MKTASEMPSELQAKRDELASNHAFQMMRTMEGASPNTRRDFKYGFNKCFELMSAAIEEERQARLKSYSDLDDINCDLNWKLNESRARESFLHEDLQAVIKQREKYIKLHYEAEEREAKLKAQLEKANESLRKYDEQVGRLYRSNWQDEAAMRELVYFCSKDIDKIEEAGND